MSKGRCCSFGRKCDIEVDGGRLRAVYIRTPSEADLIATNASFCFPDAGSESIRNYRLTLYDKDDST
jgi:hypothetical protein